MSAPRKTSWCRLPLALVLFSLLAAGCTGDTVVVARPAPSAVPVEIEVEVYDPASGGVWQDVGVRVVESWQEWSGLRLGTTRPDLFVLTDRNGLVYLSPQLLADYDVGFGEDALGRAIVGPQYDRDEAVVLIEVFAPGFASRLVEVQVDWDQPYTFVSVPFR